MDIVHVDPSFFPELSSLLSQIQNDAQMALNGSWDRSDDGFTAIIDSINNFAERFNLPLYSTEENDPSTDD